MEKLDLDEILREYAQQCGPHDFGMIEFACSCPTRDPRHIVVTMVEHLKKIYENYDMLLCSTQAEAMDRIEEHQYAMREAYLLMGSAVRQTGVDASLREKMYEWRERIDGLQNLDTQVS